MGETKTRINKFDNLKGLAILLIVLGHMTMFRSNGFIGFIRSFVFLIHLPVFFFVAGYFSKIGPDEPIKAFKRLFIPFIVFCLIWEVFNIYVLGNPPKEVLFLRPGYMLWFLMCLFFMKMALPIMDRFKYPLTISIIGALLIGFVDSNILGISRTFAFMPLFILGFYYEEYKSKFVEKVPIVENNKFAICILILAIVVSVIIAFNVPYDIICKKHAYGNNWMWDMLLRGIILIVSTIDVLVLTRFMTNDKIMLTKWGINSFTVYLFHPYAIKLTKMFAKPYLKGHTKMTILFIFVMAFVITYVLSRDFFTKALNKFLNLIYKVLCIE